ncbi:MAG: fructose-1,6-bisphosphatase, partial [Eubacterium sp.]|nr:fructose-1,6-bisphosphatase [Eubacterium sp.]
MELSNEKSKYLNLLAEKYPTRQHVSREIINLKAILNLPKGTEHFMSDIHGEYEAFNHILNNCSGVIKEKVEMVFAGSMSEKERQDLCTLIYYPEEKLKLLKKENILGPDWYRMTLKNLIELARFLSSKYTRSKVRKAMPEEFSYIIDELLHAQPDEDNNQLRYHEKILETIIGIDSAEDFIKELTSLIKRLAVDHLHIVGDIFDRGERADEIMDMLMSYHSLDIEWGNHDILWMGAAAGSEACIANVVRNNLKYQNMSILENGYGISLRRLLLFAQEKYPQMDVHNAVYYAITVILLKLEGQIIKRHPEYKMDDRLLLHKINMEDGTITIEGATYPIDTSLFGSLDKDNPYELSPGEVHVMNSLKYSFANSSRLKKHVGFLYSKGAIYICCNNNLLFHGCIPLDKDGNFEVVEFDDNLYKGKSLLDYADKIARRAYYGEPNQNNLDFMWYLWGGKKSPLCGRNIKTFERAFIDDETASVEEKDPYYHYYLEEKIATMILREFKLYSDISHIINGHTPIKVGKGETPIRAGGKVIVIDGGFCKAYQKTTGIAGYTLIYNSHGMRIKAHQPFESVEKVLIENKDIESSSDSFETEPFRVMVENTDVGKVLADNIKDLEELLY